MEIALLHLCISFKKHLKVKTKTNSKTKITEADWVIKLLFCEIKTTLQTRHYTQNVFIHVTPEQTAQMNAKTNWPGKSELARPVYGRARLK